MPDDANNAGTAGETGGGEGSQGQTGQGAGTVQTGTWRDQLPSDLRTHEAFTKYEKLGDLGKDFVDLQGKAANSIPKLSETATDAEREAFYTAIGRPKDPSGYEFQVPEEFKNETKLVDWFKAESFKNGLPKAAAEQLANEFFAFTANHNKSLAEQVQQSVADHKKQAEETLRGKWKGDFDKNLDAADQFLQRTASPEIIKHLKDTNFADNAMVIEYLYSLSKSISEGQFVSGSGRTAEMEMTTGGIPKLSFPSMQKK